MYNNLRLVVALLGVEEETACRNAAQILCRLCTISTVSGFWKVEISQAGGLFTLLKTLHARTDDCFSFPSECALYSLQAVVSLIQDDDNNTQFAVRNGVITILVRMLLTSTDCSILSAQALLQVSLCDDAYTQLIREQGGLHALVTAIDMLHHPDSQLAGDGPARDRSAPLTRALMSMMPPPDEYDPDDCGFLLNREAIVKSGGTSVMIRILDEDPMFDTVDFSIGVLLRLSCEDEDVQNDIRAQGGIQKLISLLDKASVEMPVVGNAIIALHQIGKNNFVNQELIRREGGLRKLVALLHLCEVEHRTLIVVVRDALNALCVNNDSNAGAFLDQLEDLPDAIANDKSTLDILQRAAEERICEVASTSDGNMFDHEAKVNMAIERAQLVRLSSHQINQAAARNRDAAHETKRKRDIDSKRKVMGIHELPEPDEFVCPITLEVMQDPVVASDGRSYERRAIERVLKTAQLTGAISPISREPLLDQLFENRNLRVRIMAHNEDLLAAAGMALTKASLETNSHACMRV